MVEQFPVPSSLVFFVTFAHPLNTGTSSSTTVTSKPQLPVFVDESVEVHVTGVVPFVKTEPLGGVQTTVVAPSQLSLAVGV